MLVPLLQNSVGGNSLPRMSNAVISTEIGLVSCQFLDGVLTYMGLSIFGITMEGNVILRDLMQLLGLELSLFFVKSLAVVLTICLCRLSKTNQNITVVMLALIFMYLYFALIPWTRLIFS